MTNFPDKQSGLTGTRRRSDVIINGVLAYGSAGFDWIEVLNEGPTIDLNGWSLVMYDSAGTSDTYTLSGATVPAAIRCSSSVGCR